MSTFPVEAPALAAPPEFLVVPGSPLGKPGEDVLLSHPLDRAVAGGAPREGPQGAAKIETFYHLVELRSRFGVAHQVAVIDRAPFEQAPIAREQDALLAPGVLDQSGVAPVVAVQGVESQEPEIARESPEMNVGDEVGLPEGARPYLGDRGNVKGLEHRIDAHSISVLQPVAESDGPPVHQHEIDLGMGDPHRFDQILDGLARSERTLDVFAPVLGGKKVAEFGVEADPYGARPATSDGPLGGATQ